MIWVAVIPHPNASPMSFENTSAPLIDEDTVAELLDACWEGEEAAFVVFWSRATAFLRSVTSSLVSMRETHSTMAFRKLGDDATRLRRLCGALGYVPGMSATCSTIASASYGWTRSGLSEEEAHRCTAILLDELEAHIKEVTKRVSRVYWEKGLVLLEEELGTTRSRIQ